MEIQLQSSARLTKEVCEQLEKIGLKIQPSDLLVRNFCFNAPVVINGTTHIECSKIDAYSSIAIGCYLDTVAVGRFSTISRNCFIGIPEVEPSAVSAAAVFTHPEFFTGLTYAPQLSPNTINNALADATAAKQVLQAEQAEKMAQAVEMARANNNGSDPVNNDNIVTAVNAAVTAKDTAHISERETVTIGHDVLLQVGCKVRAHVTIGHGAIIETNTLVDKDIPPYALVRNSSTGAEVYGYRFSDEIIADLLELQWWQYDFPRYMGQGGAKAEALNTTLNDIKSFISFLKNEDLSAYPKIPEAWRYLAVKDEKEITLYNVTADCNMSALCPRYPQYQTFVDRAKIELYRQQQYQARLS